MTLKYNMKFFYTKLVNIETLISNLDELDLSAGEKAHLANLVDSSLHSAILDEILSNLSPEDKKLFLEKLETEKDHDKILEFLNEKIDNVADFAGVILLGNFWFKARNRFYRWSFIGV